MRSILEHASRRTSVALTMLLVVLLPSLLITTPDASRTLALAVLAVACAALVRFGNGGVALAARARLAMPATHTALDASLPGRVTDPTHHPLRPRAPGTA